MARMRVLPPLAVAFLALLPYPRVPGYAFVFDDLHLIVHNAFLKTPWSAFAAFGHDFWHGTPFGPAYYRPLVVASLALNGRLLGWGAPGFHLVNMALHALGSVLLYFVARRLGAGEPGGVAVAALFALHPVAAWPVASIVARVDLLPAVFLLSAWGVLASGVTGDRFRRAAIAGGLFLCALLCKESAAAFLVVPLMSLRRMKDDRPTPGRAPVVACVAALALCLAMRSTAGVPLAPTGAVIDPLTNPLSRLPQPARSSAAIALAGRYVLYLIAPVRFSDPVDYFDPATWPAPGSAAVLLPLLGLMLWGAGAFVLWLRREPASIPLAFALGALLPASNILFPISSLYAQNFLYLPLAGGCLALSRMAIPGRIRGRLFIAGATALLVAGLGIASCREASIWRDDVSLMSAWTERFPAYPPALSALGVALLNHGRPLEAIAPLRRALALSDASVEGQYNLAVSLLRTGSDRAAWEEALGHLRRALELVPAFPEARANAARALLLLDRPAEAAEEARAALRLDPGLTPARALLDEALRRAGAAR